MNPTNDSQQSLVSNQSNPTTPPKPMKKTPLIIGVVLLMILLTSGAYYLGLSSSKQGIKQLSHQSTLPSNSPTVATKTNVPVTTVTPGGISGWKSFTNSTYNYSFSYPPQFTVIEEKHTLESTDFSGNKVPLTQYFYKFSTGKLVNGTPDWSGFAVSITPTSGKTIVQEFAGQKNSGEVIGVTPIQQNGADEADITTHIENGDRVYRFGNNFFQVGNLQDANLLPDGSDDASKYLPQVFDSMAFHH